MTVKYSEFFNIFYHSEASLMDDAFSCFVPHIPWGMMHATDIGKDIRQRMRFVLLSGPLILALARASAFLS